MEVISSFKIDHTKLKRGLFISRVDKDITTFDIRMKEPNREEVMTTGSMHALEHLGATYLRNSCYKDRIIYFGPMGCRTGYYMIMRDMSQSEALVVVFNMMHFILHFQGKIPGASPAECGNWSDSSLEDAKKDVLSYIKVIEHPEEENLIYPEL